MAKKKHKRRKKTTPEVQSAAGWIQELARVVSVTRGESSPRMRTALSCHVTGERQALYLPPEMPALQPRSLRYLSAFAMRHNFQLVEDRRHASVSAIVERRDDAPPVVAQGLAELMKQTGLPGAAATLSEPHRLAAENPLLDLPSLIRMTAHAAPSAKHVVLLPNASLVDYLDNETLPISAYGCLMDSVETRTLLTHFHGQSLRCIGYSSGSQYVMHVLLGGGPLSSPQLWTSTHSLSRSDIRFRLFHGQKQTEDFGLLYTTFYFDMAQRSEAPWWLAAQQETATTPNTQLFAG